MFLGYNEEKTSFAMDKLRLAQLLCSRLCHDLITPVGAINNGFEFLGQDLSQADLELYSLMQKSAHTAVQRLMMFRAACGHGGQNIVSTFAKTEQIIRAYLESHNITFMFHDVQYATTTLTSPEQSLWGRVLVNLASVLMESAPKGGELNLTVSQIDGTVSANFILSGHLNEIKQDHILALTGHLKENDVTVHSIQSYVTWLLMEQIPLKFELGTNSNQTIQGNLHNINSSIQASGSLF